MRHCRSDIQSRMCRFAREGRSPECPEQDDVSRSVICFGSSGLVTELLFQIEPLGTECTVDPPAYVDLPQISFPENPAPVSCGLARRRPLERSANFSDRLVAILVQFLESLLQRPEFHGAFRRPFPVDVESVGGRWTGRRSLHEAPAPLASMCRDRWWKTYLHALQNWNPAGIRSGGIPCGHALAL